MTLAASHWRDAPSPLCCCAGCTKASFPAVRRLGMESSMGQDARRSGPALHATSALNLGGHAMPLPKDGLRWSTVLLAMASSTQLFHRLRRTSWTRAQPACGISSEGDTLHTQPRQAWHDQSTLSAPHIIHTELVFVGRTVDSVCTEVLASSIVWVALPSPLARLPW